MQRIDTPKRPCEVIHMDFASALPPAGLDSLTSYSVVIDRLTKRARFVAFHATRTAQNIAELCFREIIADVGVPLIIISDRDPKFTSGFWERLFKMLGCNLNMTTSHHPQTDGQAERMVQVLVDMIRRSCAFGLVYTDKTGYRHDWVT